MKYIVTRRQTIDGFISTAYGEFEDRKDAIEFADANSDMATHRYSKVTDSETGETVYSFMVMQM